ncbi:MAG TPA: hypothetical protein VGG86_14040 [Roseiarcus sp.]|jgi:hypothetical protein
MPAAKQLDFDFSIRNVREIQIEHAVGYSKNCWLSIRIVADDGKAIEIAAWPTIDGPAPELVVDDDVSVRRVKTIHEEESAPLDPPNEEMDL